jgi:hypothetical protein
MVQSESPVTLHQAERRYFSMVTLKNHRGVFLKPYYGILRWSRWQNRPYFFIISNGFQTTIIMRMLSKPWSKSRTHTAETAETAVETADGSDLLWMDLLIWIVDVDCGYERM